MTKFILHGGATAQQSLDNKRFFFEILKGFDSSARILCVYFARDKEEWSKLFKQDQVNFSSVESSKKLNFLLANKSDFSKQIQIANIVYLRGGDTTLLKQSLGKMKNFKQLIHGKVVVGSSAGAHVLAKHYYSNSENQIKKGFGILPIKVFCHYKKGQVRELKELKEHGGNFKIYTLPEEKYIVIKQSHKY